MRRSSSSRKDWSLALAALHTRYLRPLWAEFSALIPPHVSGHRYGGHRPRISDFVVFEKIVLMLRFGASYREAADSHVSESTIRRRWNEWIELGLMEQLELLILRIYDEVIGLDLSHISIDGSHGKAPWAGEEIGGRSPVDRGKKGIKRSTMVEANGVPIGSLLAPGNRHDSPLLAPTLAFLKRLGALLPEKPVVHLDAGYDSGVTRELLSDLGMDWEISLKGKKVKTKDGYRWMVERAHAWHHNYRKTTRMTERRIEVANAWMRLVNATVLLVKLINTQGSWPGQ